jgi:hypothetical protein
MIDDGREHRSVEPTALWRQLFESCERHRRRLVATLLARARQTTIRTIERDLQWLAYRQRLTELLGPCSCCSRCGAVPCERWLLYGACEERCYCGDIGR